MMIRLLPMLSCAASVDLHAVCAAVVNCATVRPLSVIAAVTVTVPAASDMEGGEGGGKGGGGAGGEGGGDARGEGGGGEGGGEGGGGGAYRAPGRFSTALVAAE